MSVMKSAASSTLVNGNDEGNASAHRWNVINVQAPLSPDEFIVQGERENAPIAVRVKKADALSPRHRRTFTDGQTGQSLFQIGKKSLSLTPSYFGKRLSPSSVHAFAIASQPFTSGIKLKGHLTSAGGKHVDVSIKADSAFTQARVLDRSSGDEIATIMRVYADAASHFIAQQKTMSSRHTSLRQDMGGDRCSYALTLAAYVDVAQVAAVALVLEDLVRGSQDAVNATGGVGRVGGA